MDHDAVVAGQDVVEGDLNALHALHDPGEHRHHLVAPEVVALGARRRLVPDDAIVQERRETGHVPFATAS